MDRFLMHVTITYPSDENEVKVLRLVRAETAAAGSASQDDINKIAETAVFDARREIDQVVTADVVEATSSD